MNVLQINIARDINIYESTQHDGPTASDVRTESHTVGSEVGRRNGIHAVTIKTWLGINIECWSYHKNTRRLWQYMVLTFKDFDKSDYNAVTIGVGYG